MKTTIKIATWSLGALIAAGFTACKKDDIEITEPHMTLTNNLGYIELDIIDAESEVWIDLNNNGIKENNEVISSFHNKYGYSFSSKTVTIYGKVTELDCSFNHLTALDVSKNSALTNLECNHNQLKALDVSKNSALKWLNCTGNQLTNLNLSKNTNLSVLVCSINHLTELNVSKNSALKWLHCNDNQLTELNVSKNTKLEYLYCYNNNIYDSKMDALVNSLPDRTASTKGSFYVIKTGYGEEGNTCNPAQVYIATNKNWKVLNSDGQPYNGQ